MGLSTAQIAELLGCHPVTVRCRLGRFKAERLAGLADQPCSGPRLGGKQLTMRIDALLARLGPWTLSGLWRYLGRPDVSGRTLYWRVHQVAIWRRPKLIAVVAPITTCRGRDHARLIELPHWAVVCTEDEVHLNWLPHLQAGWTPRGARPGVLVAVLSRHPSWQLCG